VNFQLGTRFSNFFALCLLFLLPLGAAAAGRVCDVRQHGAKGDGVTKDTLAIQAAIDECARAGGGRVRLSGGTFLSAPIVLRSHITLELAAGVVLLGSPDHDDYPAKIEFRSPGQQSLVSATDAEDVAITGSGVIDGNGESWWIEARRFKDSGILGSDHSRPRLVVFDHCHHIHVAELAHVAAGALQLR
jgi:polygalacturonase